jgi:hypothetical protein
MPSRPDLREIAANVKEAFADMDKETLLEILTFVVKEYVVEGPPPMLVHQAETLSDLAGASFAQLISAMQTRFDHPELQLFTVDGNNVSVRVGGVMQPLLPGAAAAGRAPAAELPRPAAGVHVVEANVGQRPAQPATPPGVQFTDTRPAAPPAPPQQASAPPPSRGLSVRGQPSGEGAPRPPAAPGPAQGQPPAAQGAQGQPPAAGQPGAPAPSDKPESPSGDDASARFSLLELD